MYVCICNALTEQKVRSAAQQTGKANPAAVYKALGCAFQCGQCRSHAKKVVAEAASLASFSENDAMPVAV